MMMMMTSYNTMLQKVFTLSPPKKPFNTIVSFLKVCKRTPQSEIPLTFHRRVGWGDGERRVKRERRRTGVRACFFFFFFWWGGGWEGGEIMNSMNRIWNYIKYL